MNASHSKIKDIWTAAWTPRFLAVFIAVWAAVILFSGIPYGDLSGYDDAAYAHEAKVMLQSGDLWTPNLNGNVDFDKPPLFIWLLALSFRVFGTSDLAAKIPGVLLGWATLVLVYFLAKELFLEESDEGPDREWLPVAAMFCMATTQYFLKYSSHAMTDVPFTFFFTLAIYFYVRALKSGPYLLASGIATGFALMLRSPMGIFPIAIIFLHLAFTRQFKSGYALYFSGSLLLALAIPAVWYLREYAVFGQTFIDQHFANLLAHSAASEERTAPQKFFWYFEYIFLIIKLYIPWFVLMVHGIYLALKKARFKEVPIEMLLITWILVVLVPFSFADSKVLRYILPAFPAFSIFAATSLTNLVRHDLRPKFARLSAMVLALAALVLVPMPSFQARAEDIRAIAPISDASTNPAEKVLLYTSGEYQWNFLNQLLWYGNRLCIHARELKEIDDALSATTRLIVVTDRHTSAELAKREDIIVTSLGESKNLVCLRVDRR